jgi:hypothetical protein
MLLIDADAFAKLAHWNLLDELPRIFACSWEDMSVLPSVGHRAKRVVEGKADRLFFDKAAAERALRAIERMGTMPAPDTTSLEFLQNAPQIDAGEAVLFASAGDHGYVLTGDKRALTALTKTATPPLAQRLQGRIVCVEQVLVRALDLMGFEQLRERVCPHRTIDKMVAAVFGSTCQTTESDVRQGLNSYIRAARTDCPMLSD